MNYKMLQRLMLIVMTSLYVGINAQKEDVAEAISVKTMQIHDQLDLEKFTKTDDGIQFKITNQGSGEKIARGMYATVHYKGHFLQENCTNEDCTEKEYKVGSKFDSSYDRHKTFEFKVGAKQVISGWDTMVADMKIGEKRIIILPAKYAYGDQGVANIPANSTLIFEIEVKNSSQYPDFIDTFNYCIETVGKYTIIAVIIAIFLSQFNEK